MSTGPLPISSSTPRGFYPYAGRRLAWSTQSIGGSAYVRAFGKAQATVGASPVAYCWKRAVCYSEILQNYIPVSKYLD